VISLHRIDLLTPDWMIIVPSAHYAEPVPATAFWTDEVQSEIVHAGSDVFFRKTHPAADADPHGAPSSF
jgi:hypothetical protein